MYNSRAIVSVVIGLHAPSNHGRACTLVVSRVLTLGRSSTLRFKMRPGDDVCAVPR